MSCRWGLRAAPASWLPSPRCLTIFQTTLVSCAWPLPWQDEDVCFFSLCTLMGESDLWCGLETNMEVPLGPWTWGQLSRDWCDGHPHGDSKIPIVRLQLVIPGDCLPRVSSWTVYNSNFDILWILNNHFVDCLPHIPIQRLLTAVGFWLVVWCQEMKFVFWNSWFKSSLLHLLPVGHHRQFSYLLPVFIPSLSLVELYCPMWLLKLN